MYSFAKDDQTQSMKLNENSTEWVYNKFDSLLFIDFFSLLNSKLSEIYETVSNVPNQREYKHITIKF